MLNQYIRFIFEASCDTDDWSNNVENSSLITAINYILQYINIKTVILNFILFHNIIIFTAILIK